MTYISKRTKQRILDEFFFDKLDQQLGKKLKMLEILQTDGEALEIRIKFYKNGKIVK